VTDRREEFSFPNGKSGQKKLISFPWFALSHFRSSLFLVRPEEEEDASKAARKKRSHLLSRATEAGGEERGTNERFDFLLFLPRRPSVIPL